MWSRTARLVLFVALAASALRTSPVAAATGLCERVEGGDLDLGAGMITIGERAYPLRSGGTLPSSMPAGSSVCVNFLGAPADQPGSVEVIVCGQNAAGPNAAWEAACPRDRSGALLAAVAFVAAAGVLTIFLLVRGARWLLRPSHHHAGGTR